MDPKQPTENISEQPIQAAGTTNMPITPPSSSDEPKNQTETSPADDAKSDEKKAPESSAPPTESLAKDAKMEDNKMSPPPPKPEKHVSIRTILLIIGLAILTAVLLFVALKPLQKIPTSKITAPTPTPTQAHSILSMQLDNAATPSGSTSLSTKSVNVLIDTSTNKVEGVQFDISYDPTILTNVTVTPGTFFPGALTLLNQVDTKNGKIHYALGIQPTDKPQTGTGTVAVITFVMLPTKDGSTTKLSFLPKTQVVEQGTLGSVMEKSIDLEIPTTSLNPKGAIQPTASQ